MKTKSIYKEPDISNLDKETVEKYARTAEGCMEVMSNLVQKCLWLEHRLIVCEGRLGLLDESEDNSGEAA